MKKRQLLIEKVALGEADVALLNEAEKDEIEKIKADDAAILARYPVEEMSKEIERRRRAVIVPMKRKPVLHRLLIAAPVAAVITFAILSVGPGGQTIIDPPEQTRIKGVPQLFVYRQVEGRPERLLASSTVKKGDLLQLGYRTSDALYGVICSLDGRGAVTLHLPKAGAREATKLELEATQLPFSYELDDAPEMERFFFVTGKEPFSIALVEEAAKTLAHDPERETKKLELPTTLEQTSILLRKESL